MTPTQLEVRLTAELIAQQEAREPSEAVLRSRARLRLLSERRAAARKTLHNNQEGRNGHV